MNILYIKIIILFFLLVFTIYSLHRYTNCTIFYWLFGERIKIFFQFDDSKEMASNPDKNGNKNIEFKFNYCGKIISKTLDNGYIDLWVPKNQNFLLNIFIRETDQEKGKDPIKANGQNKAKDNYKMNKVATISINTNIDKDYIIRLPEHIKHELFKKDSSLDSSNSFS